MAKKKMFGVFASGKEQKAYNFSVNGKKSVCNLEIPIAIIIGCLILGVFLYVIQVKKQESIEKQQIIEIENEKRIEEAKLKQAGKEYAAKRKSECYDIEQRERKTWTNVADSFYNEQGDICYIHYKTKEYKGVNCEEKFGRMTAEELDCELGQFTKRF